MRGRASQMRSMDAKTKHILLSAFAMFARYGYAKTTMSDIAAEAGVARQTVYNAFESKEEILRAVVKDAGATSLAEVQEAWAAQSDLSSKLAAFQRLGPLAWYKAMRLAPDWANLMDGVSKEAVVELAELEANWIAALVDLLGQHRSELAADCDLFGAAEFIYATSKNSKTGAQTAEDMERRLATIHAAAMALLTRR